jgi:uncharacterized membrane protein YdjX (TVP38/TMEM64 family)
MGLVYARSIFFARTTERPVSPTSTVLRRLEAVLILGGSFAVAAYVVARRSDVEHFLGIIGPWSIPLAIVIFAVVASAPFSVTDALAVMNGVIFGPWLGSAVNAAGLVVAAVAGYYVALRTSKLLNIEESVQRLPGWVRRFQVGSPMFLIVVRILPGLGGTIATQVAAALRVPMWRQIYSMCAIAVPLCTALAFGGDILSNYIANLESKSLDAAHRFAEHHHLQVPRHLFSPAPTPSP